MGSRKTLTPEERAERIAEVVRVGIVEWRLYEPYLAAALLGIGGTRPDLALSGIPEELLPVHRIGPNGGLKRYLGRNLLAYIQATGAVLELEEVA